MKHTEHTLLVPTQESSTDAAGEGELITSENLSSYFANQVATAIDETKLSISPDAEFYLVSMLTCFAGDGEPVSDLLSKPLALLFYEANQALPSRQVELFRVVGDGALYLCGFFADRLARSMVDEGYFAQLGGQAYVRLANIFRGKARGQAFSALYQELAGNYLGLIAVLNDISERSSANESANDVRSLVRLYERWTRTKSRRLQRALIDQGFFPGRGSGQQRA